MSHCCAIKSPSNHAFSIAPRPLLSRWMDRWIMLRPTERQKQGVSQYVAYHGHYRWLATTQSLAETNPSYLGPLALLSFP